MALDLYSPRNLQLARTAKRYGAKPALRIVYEAKRAGLPVSAGFAMVEKESAFRNVFGHDPTQSIPDSWKGTTVTKDKYRYYKSRRGKYGMQGVGYTQLTWYEYQDRADALGGGWIARNQLRVGFSILATYYKANKARGHSTETSLRLAGQKYNGSGPAAEAYGRHFVTVYHKWHARLT